MNAFGHYWKRFKQEYISIIFLSLLQTWWAFNFPAYTRLGNFWGTIVSTSLSIGGIILIFYLFLNADMASHVFDAWYIDNSLNPRFLKRILSGLRIIVSGLVFFFIWYFDMYGMSTVYYAALYMYFLVFYFLLYQATSRMKLMNGFKRSN